MTAPRWARSRRPHEKRGRRLAPSARGSTSSVIIFRLSSPTSRTPLTTFRKSQDGIVGIPAIFQRQLWHMACSFRPRSTV
jgi:hypothetical protein